MTRSRSWTTAAVERSSDRAKEQLPGFAANSPSRQEADTHDRPVQAFEVIPRNTERGTGTCPDLVVNDVPFAESEVLREC